MQHVGEVFALVDATSQFTGNPRRISLIGNQDGSFFSKRRVPCFVQLNGLGEVVVVSGQEDQACTVFHQLKNFIAVKPAEFGHISFKFRGAILAMAPNNIYAHQKEFLYVSIG
jgi:hypothetical protein